MLNKKHLDLGCGLNPRNPYSAELMFGCDLRDIDADVEEIGFSYKKADLAIESIPYPDNFFDSVSAYDFLEHIPRQLIMPSGVTCNPFINLMNEIHRVLVPNGLLLALTPAFPYEAAFTDPTHVNFITKNTHKYFTGDTPSGVMYGFRGKFKALQVRWDVPANVYHLSQPGWRKTVRRIHRRLFSNGIPHLLWEFQANKGQV